MTQKKAKESTLSSASARLRGAGNGADRFDIPASGDPLELDVDLSPSSESHFFVDLSGDATKAGIFVATWRDIRVGESLTIKAELPAGLVVVRGVVRWV